jgi:hypothetical protein
MHYAKSEWVDQGDISYSNFPNPASLEKLYENAGVNIA